MTYQRIFTLYDYDRRLIEIVEDLAAVAEKIQDSTRNGDLSQMEGYLREIRKNVRIFEEALNRRMDIILNKKVFADEGTM